MQAHMHTNTYTSDMVFVQEGRHAGQIKKQYDLRCTDLH
jgi:hypothetical protein